MSRTLVAPLVLLVLLAPASGRAQRRTSRSSRPPGLVLPSAEVLTNLRSPTGRAIYLILRPAAGEAAEIARQGERLAQSLNVRLAQRSAGALHVMEFSHEASSLNVHRHGSSLTLSVGPPAALDPSLTRALHVGAGRSEADLDAEIMLRAGRDLRDREGAQGSSGNLVAMAQGAAARIVLARLVKGDEVGAALYGARYLPFLQGHPDARLLKEVALVADSAFDVTTAPAPKPKAPAPTSFAHGVPPRWDEAVGEALAAETKGRAALHAPDHDKQPRQARSAKQR